MQCKKCKHKLGLVLKKAKKLSLMNLKFSKKTLNIDSLHLKSD